MTSQFGNTFPVLYSSKLPSQYPQAPPPLPHIRLGRLTPFWWENTLYKMEAPLGSLLLQERGKTDQGSQSSPSGEVWRVCEMD